MSLFAILFSRLQAHRATTPVFIGSLRSVTKGRRSMRVAGRFAVPAQVRLLYGAQPAVVALFHPAFLATPFRLGSALAQRLATSAVFRVAHAASRHSRPFSVARVSRFVRQSHTEKTALSLAAWANPALNPVRFALWTLRDKAAQRRLALR